MLIHGLAQYKMMQIVYIEYEDLRLVWLYSIKVISKPVTFHYLKSPILV